MFAQKNWWFFYILLFIFIGVSMLFFFKECKNEDLILQTTKYTHQKLNQLESAIECGCNDIKYIRDTTLVVDTVSMAYDSLRVLENDGDFGCLSFTLTWNTYDDLDLGIKDPYNDKISFQKHCRGNSQSKGGGKLQIDMNAGGPSSDSPVEHVNFECGPELKNGSYHVYVWLYRKKGRSRNQSVPYNLTVRQNGTITKSINGMVGPSTSTPFVLPYILEYYIQ